MTDSARFRNRKSGATPAVAPIARAIRSALVVSSLALSLAAPVVARAAAATAPAGDHVAGRSVLALTGPELAVFDPTVVVDGASPSAVISGRPGIARVDDGRPAAAIFDLDFNGTIDEVDDVATGAALAIGLEGVADEFAAITNHGSVAATAISGDDIASAYGIGIDAGYIGIGVLINAGDLAASATAGAGANAYATAAFVYAEIASIFNDASATATATAVGGEATARGAWTYSINSLIANYGDLGAIANADGGIATARGADGYGLDFSQITNDGEISAIANAGAIGAGGVADATGTYSWARLYSSYTTNDGSIVATAQGDQATANGVINFSTYIGNAVTINSGDIAATAIGGLAEYGEIDALAFGIYNSAYVYDSVVDNSGTVNVVAQAMAEIDIDDGMTQAQALGIVALNILGYGTATVFNSGDVHASSAVDLGLASTWGIAVQSSGVFGGSAVIENSGDIFAEAFADVGVAETIGASATNYYGRSEIVNHGDIVAVATAVRGIVDRVVDYADATAVRAVSLYEAADVANYGDVTAISQAYGAITYATGVETQGATTLVQNAAGATIGASATVDRFGLAAATGVFAAGYTYAGVVNDGTILAYGLSHAFLESDEHGFYGASSVTGIAAVANVMGDVNIVNNGDVVATAIHEDGFTMQQSGAGATGINTYAKYDATVVNHGDVFVTATSNLGIASAYGIVGEGKYSTHIVNDGDVFALATVGSLADDVYGGRAFAMGLKSFNSDHVDIANDGLVVAHATVNSDSANPDISLAFAWGIEVGYNSRVEDALITNNGDVEAVATAEFGAATAYGTYVSTHYDTATVNNGDVLAIANAASGNAWAVGSFGFALHSTYYVPCDDDGCDYDNAEFIPEAGVASLVNSGAITAVANAEGGVGNAYGAVTIAGFGAGMVNHGDIRAFATADEANAVGALVNSFFAPATVENDGLIAGIATGALATGTGLVVLGTDVDVVNDGMIFGSAEGADATAVGVDLTATGTATLVNTGSIGAFGDGERIAIRASIDAVADLTNAGTLVGAIRTGDREDTFTNEEGGTWFAFGSSSFGEGHDVVGNDGTVVMDAATIAFGEGDDLFDNNGVLVVRGSGNAITFGGAALFSGNGTSALGDGLFRNDGDITFVDGVTDDRLTITGDFAGVGALGFDVDALAGTADRLAIVGDVLAGTVQTLDINLLARPETAQFDIGLVNVSGVSSAGNFVLGDVAYESGFVTLDFGLVATINAAGADSFALAVAVDGLNDTGKLAAAISPGVQSLVDAQVGTWRQRAGAAPDRGEAAPVPWVRVFSASGDIAADHRIGVGSGDLGFHQSNRGYEVGIEFPVGDHLSLGGFLGQSDGDQELADDAGDTRLDGTTFGLVATWRADRFYVDASQRWTGIDATLRNGTDVLSTEMSADTFNIEAGFTAWNAGGTHIVPQLQYTHTRIGDAGYLAYGGSSFVDDGGTSSRGRLGVAFDHRIEGGSFVWTPYGSLYVVREFDGTFGHAVNGGIAGETDLSGTSGLVELGVGINRGQLAIGASANWTDGGAYDGVLGAQLSLRWAW